MVSMRNNITCSKDRNHGTAATLYTAETRFLPGIYFLIPCIKMINIIIIIIIQEFMYRDTTYVEPEMYDYTNSNWSHWNCNEKLKEQFGSCTRKTLDRFTTKDSYTWNITHNTESTAV
jgi:hypothetical protein